MNVFHGLLYKLLLEKEKKKNFFFHRDLDVVYIFRVSLIKFIFH